MRTTIAIGIVGLLLSAAPSSAQTAAERAQILRDFHLSVVDYAERARHAPFPWVHASSTAPQVFTLPVAMVFRQAIGRALATDGSAVWARSGVSLHPVALQPLPATALADFPTVLSQALPPLPARLEYRLVGSDLVIRDAEADIVVAVLRDAMTAVAITRR